ncbi:MAG: Ig-like domain-containing protein, partial [Chloroflexi bacterium]|nr:Ig-like domain-containing protein [Chloroflexota bacterium]
MLNTKTFWFTILALILLVACSGGANPLPPAVQTALPQVAAPLQQATATPNAPFPQGITNEPLAVVTTTPADKGEEVAVTKDQARIVVQFNHPVVPLVAVEAQRDLPQPLSLQPSVPGAGQWINTATFAFTPSQNLAVATQYTASLAAMKDMLGQSLTGYSWSFKTVSPAVAKTDPGDNTQYVGVSQPISITFNTEMDRATTESGVTVKRADTGAVAAGKFEWQGAALKFTPTTPLEYNQSYKATVSAGAQDVNKLAATAKDVSWTFRTTARPGVTSTLPKDGEARANLGNGFRIDFASPMSQLALKVTVQPTITNQSVWWESPQGARDTSIIAHVGGGWLASTAYTVTIGADSPTRYGERLGRDVIVKFTTAPRSPELYLSVPGEMGMYDANGPQTIVASHLNINQIDYKLYKVDRGDYLNLIGRDYYQELRKYTPKETNALRAWSLKPSAPLNATRLISTTLTADNKPLAPGVYYLLATSPQITGTDRAQKHLLVVTDLNLALKRTETESLVWVTDLKSGKPVGDQPLTLYDLNGKQLASGKSDKDGIWRATFAKQNAYDSLYVLSEASGQIVAAVGSDWNSGIVSWDFNLPSDSARDYYANLYTDRAIYRPGQTVYFKGILRRDNDAQYSMPDVASLPVNVRDAQGKQISAQNVTLTKFGTFSGELKLAESASIGSYNLNIAIGKEPNKFSSGVSFYVAEYRAPEFQVTVQADKKEYFNGDKIQVDANGSYFFGGAVGNANVTWRLLSDDLFFAPEDVKGYWDFSDYDLTRERVRQGGVIREGKGKTDAQGKFHFEVPADLKDFPLSQNFTLETEVSDINNQQVSSRAVVPVHKGRYYIGLQPQRYVGTINQEQGVNAITVNTQGAAVPNQQLTISFFEHQWYSVRAKQDDGSFMWKSSYTDTLISKVNVTTDAQGAAVAKYTPKKGGVVKVVAEGVDASNNPIRSATYQWVSGREFINWRMENNDRIDLVADKKEYAPGETAEVLIPAPFANSEALLTIERGTIREVRRLTLAGNSEKIQIPIKSDFAPNVFVSVFLVKGRGADSPTPQFKLGYTNLQVSTIEKQLKINITPDKTGPIGAHYSPGEKAIFNIQANDSNNRPVQAEFSVALVDKAIQSLMDDTAESPLDAFYGQRGLSVQTSASLVRSVERANQQLTPEAKGGGGGLLAEPVRRNFQDTAFWKADVVTDAAGRAQVSIPLPDNLT